MSNNLIKTLSTDLDNFARKLDFVLSNERDLQVRIAMYLHELKHYDLVEVEYAVPLSTIGYQRPPRKPKDGDSKDNENGDPKDGEEKCFNGIQNNFPWPNDIYADIVVEKDGKFAIVELKYGTRVIDKSVRKQLASLENRFGTPITDNIIKTQGADDIVMYNYVKDIRRIEHLSEKFPNLVGGVALLVTNDHLYWTKPTPGVAYEKFSLHESNSIHEVCWSEEFSEEVKASHKEFVLASTYTCHWNDTAFDKSGGDQAKQRKGCTFRYLLTSIDDSDKK
jgi:hypothetical protein